MRKCALEQNKHRDMYTNAITNRIVPHRTTGRPAPAIAWRRSDKIIDDWYLTLSDYLTLQRVSQVLNGNATVMQTSDKLNYNNFFNQTGSRHQSMPPLDFWRQSAEFDYYERLLAGSSPTGGSSGTNANVIAPPRQQSVSGRLVASASVELSGKKPLSNQQQQTGSSPNLLEMSVHDSVDTAVNVLKLTHLDRQTLLDTAPLECVASNLHYDLRSLIRLYAPPSLVPPVATAATAAAASRSQSGQTALLPPPSSTGNFASAGNNHLRQLVEAFERVLDATLQQTSRLLLLDASSSPFHQSNNNSDGSRSRQAVTVADDSNSSSGQMRNVFAGEMMMHQIGSSLTDAADSNADIRSRVPQLESQINSNGSSKEQVGFKWANSMNSQLVRMHQMSNKTLASPTSPADATTTTTPMSSREKHQQQSGLVRTKLIALDVRRKYLSGSSQVLVKGVSAGELSSSRRSSRTSTHPYRADSTMQMKVVRIVYPSRRR